MTAASPPAGHVARWYRHAVHFWPVWAPVLAGTFLRIYYMLITPYNVRGYDTEEHIQYIRYVVRTFQLPDLHAGWETHQPPLYYFLTGAWVKLGLLLGRSTAALSDDIRMFSLLLSLAALVLAAWIALMLFPKPSQRTQAGIFLLVPAFLPGLVFFSGRISNDVLVYPLLLLWLGLFIRWMRQPSENRWFVASIALAFALLTKMSAAPLVPAMALTMLFRNTLPSRTKVKLLVILGVTLAIIAGWQVVLRSISGYADFLLVSGSGDIVKGLYVKVKFMNYLTFNPLIILQQPFATPWFPGPFRDGFWEYFFRSSFTGEWSFPRTIWLNRSMVLLGMAALPVAAMGLWTTWKKPKAHAPAFAAMFVFLCAFLVFFHLRFPCACLQDFRYVPFIPLLTGAWFAYGLDAVPPRVRYNAIICAILLAVLCVAFVLTLGFLPS